MGCGVQVQDAGPGCGSGKRGAGIQRRDEQWDVGCGDRRRAQRRDAGAGGRPGGGMRGPGESQEAG